MAEARAPAGGQAPVLALDVVDDGELRPGQQRRHHEAHALARAGRRKAQDMLGTIMAQIVVPQFAEQHAVWREQPGCSCLFPGCPAGRAVGDDPLCLTRPPDRHGDGGDDGDDSAGGRDVRAVQEHARGVGVIGEPPPEKCRGQINWEPGRAPPWAAQFRLKAELPGGPLGRGPDRHDDDAEHDDDLKPKDFGAGHRLSIVGNGAVRQPSASMASLNGHGSQKWLENRSIRRQSFAVAFIFGLDLPPLRW